MADIVLFTASTLDGFIAGPKGELDWLFHDCDYGYADFYESIGSMIMGYKTFEVVKSFDGPYPHSDRKNYVFTRSEREAFEDVKYIRTDPIEFTEELKRKEMKDIWLVGGGIINSMLLHAELIDKMVLSIHPLTIGHGIPLFSNYPCKKCEFKLESAKTFDSGMLQVTYVKK